MGLDCEPLTYLSGSHFESVFPQLVTVLELPCDNVHVNVNTPANNIDYLLCIFLLQKEHGILGELGILGTTSMASCSRRKE